MEYIEGPQIVEHAVRSLTLTPYDVKWIPSSARFVLLGMHPRATGAIQIYKLDGGRIELATESEKPAGIKCGTFAASDSVRRQIATGDFQGGLHIYDMERLDTASFSANAHDDIINAIDGCGGLGIGGGAPEIATASRDGAMKVWDPRQRDKPVASVLPPSKNEARDCWSVAFGDAISEADRCVVAGYDNGDIKMLDLRKNSIVWETNVGNGVCNLEFDRKDIDMNKLVAVTLEAAMHVFDLRTYHREEGFASHVSSVHDSTVWFCRHLPQNRDLWMTGGGNGELALHQYEYPAQRAVSADDGAPKGVAGTVRVLQKMQVSTQPVAALDWHRDKEGLAVYAALDQTGAGAGLGSGHASLCAALCGTVLAAGSQFASRQALAYVEPYITTSRNPRVPPCPQRTHEALSRRAAKIL